MSGHTGPKAINTIYKGYRFRSRLEARWAVVFDALGVEYEYEPQGFDLRGVLYLPDFHMPQSDYWIEVKPTRPSFGDEDYAKVALLAEETERPVCVLIGQPPQRAEELDCIGFWPYMEYLERPETAKPDPCNWWKCPGCKVYQLGATVDMLPCECSPLAPNDPVVTSAMLRGRQARFEHGETPR